MNKNIINNRYKYTHLLTPICVGLLLLGIVLYVYFLSLSVMHVVMRKEALQDLNELRAEIAKLESSYIEARFLISSEVSELEDFSQTKNKIFVSRTKQNLVLNTSLE